MKKTFTHTLQRGRTWLVLLTVLFCAGTSAFGQLSMTRSLFSAAYTPIATGTGATLTTITGDDGTQTLIPIGFTFNYLGTNYTTIDACSNGWISFAAGGANAWTNTFTTTIPNLTLAAWWDDLNVGTGSVLYQTQGTAPNQTFTMQWTDVLTYNGSTSGRTIHFQIILYETTNIIEFKYSPAALSGTLNTSESASIGLEGSTGGPTNMLDAVSGSAFVQSGFMTTHKWPAAHLRFTPGAPTVLPGGTYTVGLAGTYPNLSEAIANVNHRGISGPITLSLVDATYDTTALGGYNIFPLMLGPVAGNSSTNTITIQPASGTSTLSYRGVISGGGGTQGSTSTFGSGNESIFYVIGTDYVTMRNLNLNGATSNPLVDRGLYVSNNTATDGSQNCLFENISVSLLRSNTSGIGIQQNTISAATSAAGANSTNIYRNLTISNVYAGMYLLGTAGFPDLSCQIGNTSPTAFNSIGSATSNDIGGGTAGTQTYGIRISNQSGAKVFNNYVRNVSAQTTTDGILCEAAQGTTEIYNNRVSGIRNNGTASTSFVCGMRTNIATTGSHSLRVYNNMVSGITSAYTGAATSTRIIKGIWAQSAGGGVTTCTINVDGNSIHVDGSTSLNASSAAYEIGTATGPVINTRNNSITNFTGAQTAPAQHIAWQSTAATTVGNTGSVSNYNNLYVSNTTQGFAGQGAATTYTTLANWQAAMTGQDLNSVTGDPSYVSSTDLHATGLLLNNTGNYSGSAWVTTDFDNQARSGATPDIGADEFAPASLDMKASALLAPGLPLACYSATEPCSVTITNNGLATIDFSVNPTTVTVNVTGAATATLTVVINTGTLAVGASQNVYMGTVNMSATGTYTFNGFTTVTGDAVPANDAFTAVNITISAGTASFSTTKLCDGTSVTMTGSGYSGSTLQWQSSTDFGATWVNETGPGSTTASYTTTPSDTLMFRLLVCGVHASTSDTVFWSPVVTASVTGDTICGEDSIFVSATGGTTINWYDAASGGTLLATGPVYSDFISTTTTYYAEAISGGTVASVGLMDNSAGGGQQVSTNYTIFDVISNCTLDGVYVYPGATGTCILELRDNAGGLITTSTLAVGAGDVGLKTWFPLGWNLTPATGRRLQQGAGSVSMFRNSAGVSYPYTIPGVLSITNSAAGLTFYYWGYDWRVSTGCAGPRVPVTALVNTAPAITAAPDSSSICQFDTAMVNVTSSDTTYTYLWTPSAGVSDSTSASVGISPDFSTDYIVYAESPVSGCKTSDTIYVEVNIPPTGFLTPSDTTICISDTSMIMFEYPDSISMIDTLDLAVPDGIPAGVYDSIFVAGGPSFMTGTSIVSVCFNMTHTWDDDMDFYLISPAGTMLELSTDNAGSGDNYFNTCFTPSAVTSITTAVAPCTGDWIPEGPGGFTVFNGENSNGWWQLWMVDDVGVDAGLLLDWSIVLQNPPASFSWSSDPVGFFSTDSTVYVAPDTTTIYTVTLTDSTTGCSREHSWTLNVNPPLTVDITPDPAVVCPGDSIMLTASGSGGDGNLSYEWLPASVMGATYTITPSADETVIVRLTDGCTTPEVFDTLFVNYNDSLVVDITADTSICIGDSFTISSTIVVGAGTFSYAWSTGDTSSSITVSPTSTTTYSLTVTDNCGNISTASMTLTVNPLPVADFSWIDNGDSSATFTNMSIDATSYSWDFGDGTGTSTATNPTYTYTSDGTWIVTLIATNACGSDTIVDSITVLVGTPSALSGGSAVVYPNPNNGSFNLRVYDMRGAELDVEVYNLYGQRIWFSSFTASGNEAELPVALDAPKGVYILQVRSGGEAIRFQVTVQ